MMDASSVIIVRSNTDCVIGVAAGVAVAFWLNRTTLEDVAELAKAVRSAARGTSSVRLVQVVRQTAITPDFAVRAALASMLRGLQGTVSHSIVLYEGDGFRAAMIRSIVTSITWLSNPGFPHRVFGTLSDATAAMFGAHGGDVARRVEGVVQRVRAAATGPARSKAEANGPPPLAYDR